MAFPEECWNMERNGKGDWSMEYGIGMENGDSIKETEGFGFNLCVVPLPKNKGVLNLDKQRRQRWVVFSQR